MSQLILQLFIHRATKKAFLILSCIGFIRIAVHAQITALFEAHSLGIEWQFVQNRYQDKAQFLSALILTNNSQKNLPASGWKLYFSLRYHSPSLASTSPDFTIRHVNGDLFYLTPTPTFKGVTPQQSIRIDYSGNGRIANFQDAPSGFFWVNDADSQTAIALRDVRLKPMPDTPASASTIAARFFEENNVIQDIPENQLPLVFPTAIETHKLPGVFVLNKAVSIVTDALFLPEANYLADQIQLLVGTRPMINPAQPSATSINFEKNSLPAEAYQLTVQSKQVMISAADGAGIFYGIQSLKSLLLPDAWQSIHTSISIPSIAVNDAPRFAYRGFMLDVGRNFHSKKAVLRLLEVMSLYKLNVLHFHLTDDEGWRLEIPGLPELTSVGAKRGYPFTANERLQPSYGSGPDATHSYGSGYYSRADFIEILRYATKRHIRVIPELEMPGHARAAIKAMLFRHDQFSRKGNQAEADRYRLDDPQDSSRYVSAQYFTDNIMNVTRPSTYQFIEKVVDEVQRMYTEAAAPLSLMHMGGDEVPHGAWEKSSMIKASLLQTDSLKTAHDLARYFFGRVKTILKTRGLAMTGWEELVVQESAPDRTRQVTIQPDYIQDQVQLDAWWNMGGNEDIPYRLANAGYPTVLACFDHFYFDLPNRPGFTEPGDAWIGYLDTEKLFRFVPYDYYRNDRTDVTGTAWPPRHFDKKVTLTPSGQQHIVGLKGALWSENMRADSLLDPMILPRLLALAERAWAKNPDWATEKDSVLAEKYYQHDLSVFMSTLGKRELSKLDFYNGGYNYSMPTVGTIIRNGFVTANTQFPGFQIRYSSDGKEPTASSPLYSGPIPIKGPVKLSVFNQRRLKGKTVVIGN